MVTQLGSSYQKAAKRVDRLLCHVGVVGRGQDNLLFAFLVLFVWLGYIHQLLTLLCACCTWNKIGQGRKNVMLRTDERQVPWGRQMKWAEWKCRPGEAAGRGQGSSEPRGGKERGEGEGRGRAPGLPLGLWVCCAS